MALKIEAEKMKAFKTRVDNLLIELDGSEAALGRMGDDRLRRAQLGAPELGEALPYETQTQHTDHQQHGGATWPGMSGNN
jgi:hypothetical protein